MIVAHRNIPSLQLFITLALQNLMQVMSMKNPHTLNQCMNNCALFIHHQENAKMKKILILK